MSPASNPFDEVPDRPDAPLPELPGHSSRGRLERVLRRGVCLGEPVAQVVTGLGRHRVGDPAGDDAG